LIPNPEQLEVSPGFGYVAFSGWVMLKLMSFREKDKAHLIGVLRNVGPEKIVQVKTYLNQTSYGESLLPRLSEILGRVEEESRSETDRDFRGLR
jgi:hypothetical protein